MINGRFAIPGRSRCEPARAAPAARRPVGSLEVLAVRLVARLERDLRGLGSADFGWRPLAPIICCAACSRASTPPSVCFGGRSRVGGCNHLLRVARRIRAPTRRGRKRFLAALGGRCVRTAYRLRRRFVAGRGERTPAPPARLSPRSRSCPHMPHPFGHCSPRTIVAQYISDGAQGQLQLTPSIVAETHCSGDFRDMNLW